MSSKIISKEPSIDQLKEELKEIKSSNRKDTKAIRLKEIAKSFAFKQQWDLALEALQLIGNEKERNFLIADLIEDFLLPANEIDQAKKFAKYLTPEPEIQPLVLIRIALAENDREQARQIAEHLPSPLSRNFAYVHILESYLASKEKGKVQEMSKLILENARTIYDFKSRSYILRGIAIDLYLPNHEKELAKEAVMLIPNETIRNQVLKKII